MRWLWLAAFAALWLPRLHADAFLPPRATVVLMAGLPGDVESERAYRDQLQTWLELLAAASEPPEKIFVLCESPDTFTPPVGAKVELLKASREQFLALPAKFAGRTNPVVLAAWGHGGQQGATPVFHVRGPRITPEDFGTVADAIAGESRWVLFFRNSGQFAARLAGAKRAILASEHQTLFNSDPIGLSVLLKSLRANPATPLDRLADELGHGTTAWYEDRNLARTEEPTLWLADQPPRRLAVSDKATSLSSLPAETKSPEARPDEPPAAPKTTPELSAAWKDVSKVEPRKFPDADAVVLRRHTQYTLGTAPAIAVEHEEFIQVLTAEGKHYGDFDFEYSPPDETMTFLDCEVLLPDGQLLRLDPDEIRDAGERAPGDYAANRRKFFSLPGVTPGAVLHVRYRSEWKKYPLPHVSMDIPLADDIPMLELTVRINVAKDSPFHFAFDQAKAVDPAIQQTAYTTAYTWTLRDVPSAPREPLSPPDRDPALLFSTFPDWAAFAEWYERISKLADTITPEISAKAAEITRAAKTDREKAIALYNYVTGLRYVAVPLGVNSHRPHAASSVLANQYGDCKDKANLFNTLLRSLNIDAHLVLVPRFTQAHEQLPGLAFNHAISRVKLGDEILWVDTTDDVCRFGMLPPGDPGRNVLVIDGQSRALTQLPLPRPADHRLELRASIDVTGDTDALPAEWQLTAHGFPDYDLRIAARQFGRSSSFPLLNAKYRTANGAFALAHQMFSDVATLEEAFTWEAEGDAVGLIARNDAERLVRAPFWLPKELDAALHRRQSPLHLHEGYPLQLNETVVFNLPARAGGVRLPSKRENIREPLRWSVTWAETATRQLTATLQLELTRGELSPEETSLFQQQARDLLSALSAGAAFTLSSTAAN